MIPPKSSILVATDLSPASAYTLRHVLGYISCNKQAEVRILHVCEPMSDDAKITMMMFMQNESQRASAQAQRIDLIREKFKNDLKDFWASSSDEEKALKSQIVSAEIVEGFPAEVILQQAKRHGCNMIALGAHQQGLSHTFLGTVAKRVLRRADIPTLVIPYRADS